MYAAWNKYKNMVLSGAGSIKESPSEERLEADSSFLNSMYCTEKEELEAYLEESVESANNDVYHYWKSKSLVWPRLSKMARDYLAIPATTASSERIFNTGKDSAGVSRYRLDPPSMDCYVPLSSWLKSKIVKLNLPNDLERSHLMQDDVDDSSDSFVP